MLRYELVHPAGHDLGRHALSSLPCRPRYTGVDVGTLKE
jgi:hypothetical protein